MESFIKELEKKIKNNIQVNKIQFLDNSKDHEGHKFFNNNMRHLTLIIESNELRQMDRIKAHRKINEILSKEIKNKIHALEIIIK